MNYMGIPDKKTTESEYTECAAVFLAKSLPRDVPPSAQMLNGGLKVSKHPARKYAMMRLPSLPKLSLQRCASELPKAKEL